MLVCGPSVDERLTLVAASQIFPTVKVPLKMRLVRFVKRQTFTKGFLIAFSTQVSNVVANSLRFTIKSGYGDFASVHRVMVMGDSVR